MGVPRPQWLTESSSPTQHAKGRTGDCPGPRKETITRRHVTRGYLPPPSSASYHTVHQTCVYCINMGLDSGGGVHCRRASDRRRAARTNERHVAMADAPHGVARSTRRGRRASAQATDQHLRPNRGEVGAQRPQRQGLAHEDHGAVAAPGLRSEGGGPQDVRAEARDLGAEGGLAQGRGQGTLGGRHCQAHGTHLKGRGRGGGHRGNSGGARGCGRGG